MSKLRWGLRIGVPLFIALMIAILLMAIYPESLGFGAPWLCPEDRPDPFVISYTTQTSDGTSTSSTLYCMGERGEFVEVGTWKPLLYLFGFVYAITLGLFLIWWLLGWLRRRRLEAAGTSPTADAGIASGATLDLSRWTGGGDPDP